MVHKFWRDTWKAPVTFICCPPAAHKQQSAAAVGSAVACWSHKGQSSSTAKVDSSPSPSSVPFFIGILNAWNRWGSDYDENEEMDADRKAEPPVASQLLLFDLTALTFRLQFVLPDEEHGYPPYRIGNHNIVYNNRFYLLGGVTEGFDNFINDIWCLELRLFKWTRMFTQTSPFKIPVINYSAIVSSDGCLYVFGGKVYKSPSNNNSKTGWDFSFSNVNIVQKIAQLRVSSLKCMAIRALYHQQREEMMISNMRDREDEEEVKLSTRPAQIAKWFMNR